MTVQIKRALMIISAVFAAVATVAIWWCSRERDMRLPDEKVVAMELLTEKLSGPRYFTVPVGGTPDADGPWIALEEVGLQKDRVIHERHWGESGKVELDRLISQLSEPNPARMVGGYRIPLERLNLALDSIKE